MEFPSLSGMYRWDPKGAAFYARKIEALVERAAGGPGVYEAALETVHAGEGDMAERRAKRVLRKVAKVRYALPRIEYFKPDKTLGIRVVTILPQEIMFDLLGRS